MWTCGPINPPRHRDFSKQRNWGSFFIQPLSFPRSRLCRNWQYGICCCFVIPGPNRNPVLFQSITLLDAGSVIPDLIRDRHDGQNLNTFLNCDTVWKAGIQKWSGDYPASMHLASNIRSDGYPFSIPQPAFPIPNSAITNQTVSDSRTRLRLPEWSAQIGPTKIRPW